MGTIQNKDIFKQIHKRVSLLQGWEHWNRLPRYVVEPPSLKILKTCLDTCMCHLTVRNMLYQRGWTLWPLEVPSNPRFCNSTLFIKWMQLFWDLAHSLWKQHRVNYVWVALPNNLPDQTSEGDMCFILCFITAEQKFVPWRKWLFKNAWVSTKGKKSR